MMMPANFTAVNSEVVYGGADLFTILADTTAPIWNAANVKKFNTNLITLISNSFFASTVANTLGVMFSGNWGKDNKILGENGSINQKMFGLWDVTDPKNPVRTDDMTFGNKVMQVLGMASVAYTLGTTDATVLVAYCERLGEGPDFALHFEPAPAAIASPDHVVAVTAPNAAVEAVARRDPAQYQWTYKRYTLRPSGLGEDNPYR